MSISGAEGRNRTGTDGLGPTDFKSVVSTNFTTTARRRLSYHFALASDNLVLMGTFLRLAPP